jgi:hypothetical protein
MMTPDRRSCRGVTPRRDPCTLESKTHDVACCLRCVMSEGDGFAEIPTDRHWRRAWFDCALLGGIVDRGAYGDSHSLWHVDCEHHGVHHHRFLYDLPGQTRGNQPSLAFPDSCGVHRRLQYIFNLRMGDAVDDALGGFRNRSALCRGEFRAWARSGLGGVSAGRTDFVEVIGDCKVREIPGQA